MLYSHFLFAAGLIVQSNEFGSLHPNPGYADTYQKAIAVLEYCAKIDPQASRVVYIMSTFHMMIVHRAPAASSLHDPSFIPSTPPGFLDADTPDPMANFFLSHTTSTAPTSNPTSGTSYNGAAPSQPPQPQPQPRQAPDLGGRGAPATSLAGPSPSPGGGIVAPAEETPATSAGGDLLSDAEWFHFDALWENWAAPGAGGTGGAGGGGGGAASSAMPDPAIFSDSALGGFGVGGGQAFPPSPMPGAQGVGLVGNVPLYPMMRFAE